MYNSSSSDDERNEIGNALESIWKSVLKVNTCDENTEFIQLGGDSLAAMLCISRISATIGVEIDIEEFFLEGATINGLTELIYAEKKKLGLIEPT